MYNPISAEEMALRCTIIDLVEKLKRTQFLCNYYEQCRNELVADCIRLKRERDHYLMAHRTQLQKPVVENKSKNDQFVSSSNLAKAQPEFQLENDLNVDEGESYEEIAKKLIKKFKEEMDELRKASTVESSETTNNSPNELSKPRNSFSENNPTGYQKSDTSVAEEVLKIERKIDHTNDSPSDQSRPFLGNDDHIDVSSAIQKFKKLSSTQNEESTSSRKNLVTLNGSFTAGAHSPSKDTQTVIESTIHRNKPILSKQEALQINSNMEAVQYVELCNRILKTTIGDYDELSKNLIMQNEKLRRLREKQLRCYFISHLDRNTDASNSPATPKRV